MALPTSYMTGNYTKIPQYFEAIINAQAPEKFTVKFLKDLGFTSSTDIQFINVLKSLGFLDDSGIPTELYYKLFDQSETKRIIAECIRQSYSDLFALNVNSQNMSIEELKGKFKSLTGGQKSDSTIRQMVNTHMQIGKIHIIKKKRKKKFKNQKTSPIKLKKSIIMKIRSNMLLI